MNNMKDPHTNLKIKIKRLDTDKTIEDGRAYIRRLLILANKEGVPMIYHAVDLGKYPKTQMWHVLYKMKEDGLINIRIMAGKQTFQKLPITV